MVANAEHDQFWLDIEPEQVEALSEDQIIELIRCGIMYDDEFDCLFMFA